MANGLIPPPKVREVEELKIPEIVKPLPLPTNIQVPDLNLEAEIERKRWEDFVAKDKTAVFEALKKQIKAEGGNVATDNLTELAELAKEERGYSSDGGFFPSDFASKLDGTANFGQNKKLYDRWKKAYDESNKKRFKSLAQPLQRAEVAQGGVYNEFLGLRAFTDSVADHVSFGLIGGNHPVYGKKHRDFHPIANGAGAIIGEVTSFMLLSMGAGALGLPAKLVSVAKRTKGAERLFRLTGYIPYELSRYAKMATSFKSLAKGMEGFRALTGSQELLGASTQAANQVIFGLINGFGDTTRFLAQKYRKEDRLPESAWKKNLATPVRALFEFLEGTTRGVGLSIINSPSNWSMRFLGDGLFSMAQQNYRILTGQQKEWNRNQFYYDWLLGNLLGEVQTKAFTRIFPNAIEMQKKDPIKAFYLDKINTTLESRKLNLSPVEKFQQVETLAMTEATAVFKAGRRFSDKERENSFINLMLPWKATHDTRIVFKNANVQSVNIADIAANKDFAKSEVIDRLGGMFHWSNETKKKALLKKNLDFVSVRSLLEKEAILKGGAVKDQGEIPGMSLDQLVDSVGAAQKRYRGLLKAGKLPRAQIPHAQELLKIKVEDFFLPKDEFIRNTARNEQLKIDPLREKSTERELEAADSLKQNIFESFKDYVGDIDISLATMIRRRFKIGQLPGAAKIEDLRNEVWLLAEKKRLNFYVDFLRKNPNTSIRSLSRIIYKALADRVGDDFIKGRGQFEFTRGESNFAHENFDDGRGGASPEASGLSALKNLPESERLFSYNEKRLNYLELTMQENNRKSGRKEVSANEFDNLDYSRIARLADTDPLNFMRAMSRWLGRHQQVTDNTQKKELLARFGISRYNEQVLGDWSKNITKKVRKIDQEILDENTRPALKYTEREIKSIIKKVNKEVGNLNPISNMKVEVDTPNIRRHAKKNGLFVISLKKIHDDVRKIFGDVTANHVLRSASKIINTELARRNQVFANNNDGAKIFIRNPRTDNNTSFVFYSKGIRQGMFGQFGVDMNNWLRNKYKDRENSFRKFAVAIEQPDGFTRVIDNFKEVTTGFTKRVEDVPGMAREQVMIENVAKIVNPVLNGKFEDYLFDKDIIEVRKAVSEIVRELGSSDLSFNEIARIANSSPAKRSRLADLVVDVALKNQHMPSSYPAIIQADIYAREAQMKGESKKIVAQQWNKIANRAENVDSEIKKHIDDTKRLDEELDPILRVALKRDDVYRQESAARIEQKAKAHKEGFLKGVKHFFNKGFIGESRFWLRTKLANYENDKAFQQAEQVINNIVGMKEYQKAVLVSGMMNNVYGPIRDKFMKNNLTKADAVRKSNAFDRLIFFIQENEVRQIFESMDTYSLKKGVFEKLSEPINFKDKEPYPIEGVFDTPNHIAQSDLLNIRDKTPDPLVFSKIAVQILGVKPKDYIDFLILSDKTLVKETEILFNKQRQFDGEFKNLDVFENVKKKHMDRIVRMVRRNFTQDPTLADRIDLTKEKDIELVKKIISTIPDDNVRRFHAADLKYFLKNDPNKWSYATHRVVDDPTNAKILGDDIQEDMRQAAGSGKFDPKETPILDERGRFGSETLSPVMNELLGRKFATLFELIEHGYKVELDAPKVQRATLEYLYSKNLNREIAEGFKRVFATRMLAAYKPVRDAEQRYNNIKNFRGDAAELKGNEVKQQRLMQVEVDRKKKELENFVNFFSENGGYFYRPTKLEFTRLQSSITKTRETLKNLQDNTRSDPREIVTLMKHIESIEQRKKDMNSIVNILNGKLAVEERSDIITHFQKSKNKAVKVPDAFHLQRIKNQIIQERKDFVNSIASRLYSVDRDPYIPFHRDSHLHDANRLKGPEDFEAPLFKGIKLGVKVNDIEAPNIPFYDGLYFHRIMTKGFKQFLFRDDFRTKSTSSDLGNMVLKALDNSNFVLKMIGLWKPTIAMFNNMAQGAIATPMLKWSFGNFMFGFRARSARFDKSSAEGQFYWLMNNNNLMNHTVGVDSILTDSARFFLTSFGDKKWLGFKSVINKMKSDFGESKGQGTWGTLRGIGRSITTGFRGWQETAWFLDETLRLGVAKIMFDRFLPIHGKTKAAFLAAEWTNLHMVHYSRIPTTSRRMMNRLALYPTYRIGTLRMYKEMMVGAGRGISRIWRNPDTPFRVADTATPGGNFKQGIFELGPLLRKLALTAAIKGLVMTYFGYSYEDTFDMIRGYRAKKVINPNDPFDRVMKYVSQGTPLFEMEKYMTRPYKVSLFSNISGLPRLFMALWNNTNPVTYDKMWKTSWKTNPGRASAELTMSIMTTWLPFGSDLKNFADRDLDMMSKLMNFSGLAVVYNIDSPNRMLLDFNKAIDRAVTLGEHEAAMKEFNSNMKRAYFKLFGREFKDVTEAMEEQKRRQFQERAR